ncbi:MAG: glycosyltransferase family 4 protein [Bacteroidetes bacterium]|nr:glycosyltransferase family 4 protein [Bacteroidota bacterium]MBU1720274.1 glycosyltransferase family 4 protein [Bacteroidota bacterium]
MHKGRILHVSSARSWRGGEQQLLYLVEELTKLGYQQAVYCVEGSELQKRLSGTEPGVFTYYKKSAVSLSAAGRLNSAIRDFQPDLIHCHDSHSHTMAYIAGFSGKNIPLVISRRVDFYTGQSMLSRRKYNNSRVKAIVCVSNVIAEMMKETIKDHSKIRVVYSGVDLSRFTNISAPGLLRSEYNIPDDEVLIGNVAALAPHKDYFTFLDTAAMLIEGGLNARFLIVGDGHEKLAIARYCNKLTLGNHVIFTGFRKDIPQVLSNLDLVLMTSKTEGLGTSIIDALASGVPVVSTNAGGIPEIIEHGINGLLGSIKNPTELMQCVRRMLAEPELRDACVENGKQTARNFSKENMAAGTAEIYRELIVSDPAQ